MAAHRRHQTTSRTSAVVLPGQSNVAEDDDADTKKSATLPARGSRIARVRLRGAKTGNEDSTLERLLRSTMKLRLTTEVVKKVLPSQRKSGSRFTYVTYLNSLPAANPDDLLMSDVVDNFHRALRERIAKQGRLKAALVM